MSTCPKFGDVHTAEHNLLVISPNSAGRSGQVYTHIPVPVELSAKKVVGQTVTQVLLLPFWYAYVPRVQFKTHLCLRLSAKYPSTH